MFRVSYKYTVVYLYKGLFPLKLTECNTGIPRRNSSILNDFELNTKIIKFNSNQNFRNVMIINGIQNINESN